MAKGRVRKYHSNFYYVEWESGLYECMLRGLLKKEGTEVLVGDYVTLDSVNHSAKTARIQTVFPRQNLITRPKIANVDQVFVIYSLREPDFDFQQMDRYLTHIELAGLMPVLCISKADLPDKNGILPRIQALYREQLGYTVLYTNVHQPATLQSVVQCAGGKTSVLAGPSGVGKSSLLNALNPQLQLRVGDISEKISRGQHTTRHVELLSLREDLPDTLIADTPGFSNLRFNYVLPTVLEANYRDFSEVRARCAFSDCLHQDEAGCAVLAHPVLSQSSRYQSYRDMLVEAHQHKEAFSQSSQKESFGYKQLDRKGREAVRILRLKEKNRDASRRKQRQDIDLLNFEEGLEASSVDEPLVDLPPESV